MGTVRLSGLAEILDVPSAARLWQALEDVGLPADSPAVSGFRILFPLGSGGQGATWLAVREVDGMLVAIKVARFRDREFPARHWSELRVLSECRLPCVARFEGSGIADGHPWLATEFIDGPSLDAWASTRPVPERIAMLARIADALAELHRAGIVHRDVKPANVVIARGDQPVLIDLGLGAFIDSPLDRTIDGLPAGSPSFMSPEQARGERAAIGPASDVWSLGATAFLLLTGELPHAPAGSVAAQVARVATEPPRTAAKLAPSLDARVAAVLDTAVAPAVGDRFASADEFARSLRDAAAGRWPRAVRRPVVRRRNRVVALALAAAGTAAVAFTAWRSRSTTASVGEPTSVTLVAGQSFRLEGDYPNAAFGTSVHAGTVGGRTLVAVGCPDAPGRRSPGSWVEHGGEVAIFAVEDVVAARDAGRLSARPVHRVIGTAVRGRAGAIVRFVGDLDGDGDDELAVLSRGDANESGVVHVVRGRSLLATGELDAGTNSGSVLRLEVQLGKLPAGIIGLDLDRDGMGDLVVGSPGSGVGRPGGLVVLRGARDAFGPARPEPRFVAAPAGSFAFGVALAALREGDRDAIAVGAPLGDRPGPGGVGRVLRIDAESLARGEANVLGIDEGAGPDDWFGYSIAAARVPGDDRTSAPRLIVGAPAHANPRGGGGSVHCIGRDPWEARGADAPFGQGAQQGLTVAAWCDAPWCAIASPMAEGNGAAAGMVEIRDARDGRVRMRARGGARGAALGTCLAVLGPNGSLLAGAPDEDIGNIRSAGAVWVLEPAIDAEPTPVATVP